jgi:AraC-like DNA-binding protein
LWNTEKPVQEITITRDLKLAEKLNGYTKKYIHQIENASFQSDIFRNTNLTIDDIAAHIKIPSSHINFIFKYHCNETFSDFKKIVRVHHAIKLLENNYLKTNTIESLSAEVGFITYNTFHVAFKNITGLTTQEYTKRF